MGRTALTVKRIMAPARSSGYFSRPRLLDILYESLETDLFLLKAPAGYGKTSLLADFVQHVQVAACWYTVEEADADLRTFLEYLLAAVQRRFPGFGTQVEALLEASTDPDKDIPVLMSAFANALQALDDVVLLILDDYHTIPAASTVQAATYSLLLYLPDNAHIIISGRETPNIPLSDLIVYQRVAGAGQEELAFTEEEIYGLIQVQSQRRSRRRRGLSIADGTPRADMRVCDGSSLSEEAARALAGELAYETEGWIMGILLGLQARQPGLLRPIPKDFRTHGGRETIFHYLSRQVFGRLPQRRRDFLLQTAVLDRLDAAACAALTGLTVEEAAEELEQVYREQLFVVREDDPDPPPLAALLDGAPAPSTTYRYHQLFRAFLLGVLDREYADDPARTRWALERVAARYFLGRGHLADVLAAVPHLIRAGDYGAAAATIEAYAEPLLKEQRRTLVQSWIRQIPEPVLQAHPGLSLVRARLAHLAGDITTALEAADMACRLFRQRGNYRRYASALVRRGYYAGIQGRYQEAIDNCREVILLTGSGMADFITIAEAHKTLGTIYGIQRRLVEALYELQEALSYYQTLGDEEGIADVSLQLASTYLARGELAQAHVAYRQAVDVWRQLNSPAQLCKALNNLGMLLHHLGQYAEALQVLDEALAKAREMGNVRLEAGAQATRGDVLHELGSYAEARAAFEAGVSLAERAGDSFFHNYCLDGLARCYLATGDLAQAERFAARATADADLAGTSYERGLYSTTIALIQAARGQERSAIELLVDAAGILSSADARREEAIARLHLAQLLFAVKRLDEALQHLRRAYTLIAELGSPAVLRSQMSAVLPVLRYGLTLGMVPPGIDPQELTRQTLPVTRQAGRGHDDRPSGHQVRVYTLNGTRVLVDDEAIPPSRWRRSSARALFFYLLDFPRGVRREKLAEALWPNAEPGSVESNLYPAVHWLRKALWRDALVVEGQVYRLNLGDRLWYDAQEFERLVARARRSPVGSAERIKLLQLAGDLVVTPYLEDLADDWVYARRRHLEELHIQLLFEIAAFAERQQRLDAAIACYTRVLRVDPLHEQANESLMRCYIAQGQAAAAATLYHSYAQALKEDLGLEPPPSMRALFTHPREA